MDSTALALCMDNNLPIDVFNMDDERNIDRIVSGERVGTLVSDVSDLTRRTARRRARAHGEVRGGDARRSSGRCAPAARARHCWTGSTSTTTARDPAQAARDDLAPPRRACSRVQPYDKSSIKAIEKAILESDIGLTPTNDGTVIRLQIPELTEERRKQLVKVVHDIAEEGRVASATCVAT